MIVLGVDPGTLITGYGVIEARSDKLRVLTCGAIKNDSADVMPNRLKTIFDTITTVIAQYRPDDVALETAFYGKNAQSALKLGQARGVIMLAAVARRIPTHEYSPREVKKAIVGSGAASKDQVQYMVKSLLHLSEPPKYYDVTDALAVAICHLHRKLSKNSHPFRSWKAFFKAHPEMLHQSAQTHKR